MLRAEAGGIVASIGTGWIWLVPFWGWVGRRFGLRRLLQAGYAVADVLSICAALAFGTPWLAATLLVLAALGSTETIDGAGYLLFLRAVHTYERSEMTTVFISFHDAAQLGPPAVCSLLLSLFSLPSVFVAGGLMMLAASSLSRRIPAVCETAGNRLSRSSARGSGMKAALAAGYSEASAKVQGSQLLARPDVRQLVADLDAKLTERTNVTKDWVVAQTVLTYGRSLELDNPAAARSCLHLLSLLHGYIVEKRDLRIITNIRDLSDQELAAIAGEVIEGDPVAANPIEPAAGK